MRRRPCRPNLIANHRADTRRVPWSGTTSRSHHAPPCPVGSRVTGKAADEAISVPSLSPSSVSTTMAPADNFHRTPAQLFLTWWRRQVTPVPNQWIVSGLIDTDNHRRTYRGHSSDGSPSEGESEYRKLPQTPISSFD